MQEYIFLLILLLLSIAFVAVMIFLNALVGKSPNTNAVKQGPFECGSKLFHQPGERIFQVKYTTVAILFVMFDLETILLYPWAISAREMGTGAIAGGAIFLLFLMFALVYVWRKGLLNWH